MAVREAADEGEWGLGLRLAFRFCACYLLLYHGAILVQVIPWLGDLVVTGYGRVLATVAPWVGRHVLHLSAPISTFPEVGTGNGDRLFDYLTLLTYVAVAAVGAALWSGLDAGRREYRRLAEWTYLLARYALAVSLFDYGFAKVVKVQFQDPAAWQLVMPLGELSPMDLLWTFMGYSTAYTFFAGALEVLGALLLCWRRTATLGALVAAGVLTNVVMLNLCYDVPVKNHSINLLLLAVFVMAPDLRRLADVLVLQRPTTPPAPPRLFATRRARIAAAAVQIAFVACAVGGDLRLRLAEHAKLAALPRRTALYGIYDVDEFVRGGQPVPPLATDASRWKRLAIGSDSIATVSAMDDSRAFYLTAHDALHHTLSLTAPAARTAAGALSWQRPDADHLVLTGTLSGQPVSIKLHRLRDDSMPLTTHAFHWLHQVPPGR